MDGRTYRIVSTEGYPTYYLSGMFHKYIPTKYSTDYPVWTEFFVPDSTWVVDLTFYGCPRLIGIDRDHVRSISLDNRFGKSRRLYMADQPFGFVVFAGADWANEGTDLSTYDPPTSLRYAQQINKGELGAGVSIPKLKFAREQSGGAHKSHQFDRNRNQRRNHLRWARLSDVVEASGLQTYDLLKKYWSFADWNPHYAHGPQINVRIGADHNVISAQQFGPFALTFTQLLAEPTNEVWIRSGLANTLLRLIALNYQPRAVTTA